jgi:hypothetical protein
MPYDGCCIVGVCSGLSPPETGGMQACNAVIAYSGAAHAWGGIRLRLTAYPVEPQRSWEERAHGPLFDFDSLH